jgi:hypothetical protein
MSGSYHVNLRFYGPVVHEKKICKWSYLIFALLWLSPFQEDLALHLNKVEFPSWKNALYQAWLKLAWRFILKHSFQYTHVKIVSPLVVPPLPMRTIICTSVNMQYVRKLSCKSGLFWLSGSQTSTHIFTFCYHLPLDENLALHLNIFFILFTEGWFVPSLIEISPLVLEKIFSI